jgi:hypothetical protein
MMTDDLSGLIDQIDQMRLPAVTGVEMSKKDLYRP